MRVLLTWLLVFVSNLCAVSSDYYLRYPVIEVSPLPTNESTATKFVYVEQREVNVTCSFPITPLPEGIELELLRDTVVFNPFFGRDHGYPTLELFNHTQLNVVYHRRIMIPLVTFTCDAKYYIQVGNETKYGLTLTTRIEVEQLYKAESVKILGNKDHRVVEPGDKVGLTCLGDGNPLPQYQWFNRTKDGDQELENETGQDFRFIAPTNWSGESVIVCGTRNKFNNHTVMSLKVTVTSIYIPPPVFETIPLPANTTSEKLIFMEEANVTVKCSLPLETIPEDIKLQMMIIHYDRNPVYLFEEIHTVNRSDPLQLEIQYNPERFIPRIEILCRALNQTTLQIKNSSSIVIEQKYKTMNIEGYDKDKELVEAGETVRLRCLADGNPEPQYQWYNQTENGTDIKVINGTEPILEFVTPSNWSTTGLYTCEAKNEYNADAVKSKSVSVTSLFTPPLQIQLTPLPTKDSTEDKLVFLETQNVTVTCSLPIPVPLPDYLRLTMGYHQFILYPAYPKANTTLDEQKDQLTLHIEYQPKAFTSMIVVWCKVFNRKKYTEEIRNIQIEQHYKTMNVVIEGSQNYLVEPGTKLNLRCQADGNPEPSLYQWYTKTGSGLTELAGATQSHLLLSIPKQRSSSNEYICGAKNVHNNDFVLSNSVKVSANVPNGNAAVAHYSSWLVLIVSALFGLARTAGS